MIIKPFDDNYDVEVVALTYGRGRIIVTDGYQVRDGW